MNTAPPPDQQSAATIRRIVEFFEPRDVAADPFAHIAVAQHSAGNASREQIRSVCHDLLERMLNQTQAISERAWSLLKASDGHPYLEVTNSQTVLNVSFAHTAGWIAAGLSRGARIGVDIEQKRPQRRMASIAKLLGWPGELKDLDDFHARWTMWEASAKCRQSSVLSPQGTDVTTISQQPAGAISRAGSLTGMHSRISDDLFFAAVLQPETPIRIAQRDLPLTDFEQW